jgi:hypothetical protein
MEVPAIIMVQQISSPCSGPVFLKLLIFLQTPFTDVPDIVRSILAEDKQSYALDRHVELLPWRTSLQLLKALLPHAQASLDHGASMLACICFHSKTFVDMALDCHDSEAQSEVEQLLRDAKLSPLSVTEESDDESDDESAVSV